MPASAGKCFSLSNEEQCTHANLTFTREDKPSVPISLLKIKWTTNRAIYELTYVVVLCLSAIWKKILEKLVYCSIQICTANRPIDSTEPTFFRAYTEVGF